MNTASNISLKIDDFLFLVETLALQPGFYTVARSLAKRYGFQLNWNENHQCYWAEQIEEKL